MFWRMAAVLMLSATMQACTSMEKEEQHLKEVEQSVEHKLQPYLNACKGEVDKLCKSAGSSKDKQAQCLKQNKDKAGTGCRNAIEKMEKDKK